MSITLIAIGLVYLIAFGFISYSSIRKKESTYLLILYFEYFAIFGLGLAPLLMGLGFFDLHLVSDYQALNGPITFLAFLHIFMFSVGSVLGYFTDAKRKQRFAAKILSFTGSIQIGQSASYYLLIGVGLLLLTVFIIIVGLDIAIGKASEARSGFTELMGDGLQYAFIKRLVYATTFCIVFIPFLISRKSNFKIIMPLAILALGIYSVTVARAIFIETIIFALIIYAIKQHKSIKPYLIILISAPFMYFVLFYGKEFVGSLSAYIFGGGDLTLTSSSERQGGAMNAFFGNFVHLLVSVDSGVRHFMLEGIYIPRDTMVSYFSILPSSIYSLLGLEALNYNFVYGMDRMPCVNSTMIYGYDVDQCSVPPYMYGYAAYLFPVLGGFFFGFIRFYVYGLFQSIWQQDAPSNKRTWLPLLLLLIFINLLTFIPAVVSLQVFVLLVTTFFCIFLKVVQSASRMQR